MADDRVLTFDDLAAKGWPHSVSHTWRLVKAGKFPKPFKPYEGGRRNLWRESDVDAFLADLQKRSRSRSK